MAQTILLTGGSGVLGQALLKQLTDANIICLTRQRPLQNANIATLAGDISEPQLGMTTQSYRALAARIDWIIHAAALTDFARPHNELHRCNVTGVRNILAFAEAAHAPMIHVSTAFVQPRRGHRFNGYERSKREAEALVRQSGLPATIVRPSIIVGDSATGNICKQQGIHRVMRLLLDGILPAVPGTVDARIDFVPQDRVAAAIIGLLNNRIIGGDYWLTAGEDALSLRDALQILVEHGSALLQRQVPMPRMVQPSAFAQLIEQGHRCTLTDQEQRRIEEAKGLFKFMTMGEHFASSIAQLKDRIGLAALPDPQLTFQRSLEYIVCYNQERICR